MKIAYIAIKGIDRIGGVETYTVELGRRLVDAGHQVIVYTAKTPEHPTPFYYQGMRIIPLRTLPHKYFEKMLLVIHASLHQFSINGIDVVHYHAVGPSLFSFLPRLGGRYTVFQSHGHEWERSSWNGLARLFFHISEKLTFWFANDATAVSRTLREYYGKKYHKDVTYIPTGITPRLHPAKLDKIARYGVTTGSYILYVGRLSLEKRVHDLIQAYQQLEQPRVKLVIVGSARDQDPYGTELKTLADTNPNIIFTGAVYGEALAEWYNHAYVYVLPSQMEGLPITLLEAMSLGCCCIASDIDANTEALDGKGILFPTGNSAALRERLQAALDDPAHVAAIGTTLHQHVLNHYTWTQVTQQFIQFYQKALPATVHKGTVTMMKGNDTSPNAYATNSVPVVHNAPHIVLADPPPGRDYSTYATAPNIPLSHYWSTLRQHAGAILLSTAAITALMLALAALTNPTYTAKSSVKIETTAPKLLEYDVDTARPPSYIDETVFYNTQYKMLRSRDLATEVIDTLGIRDTLLQERAFKEPAYWLIDPLKSLVGDVRHLFSGDTEAVWDTPQVSAEEIFLEHLTINPVRNSRIIDIHYTATDPAMARDVVKSMTDVFVQLQQRGKQQSAEQAKHFLDKQIDAARDKLQSSEAAMIRYARAKNIVDTNSDESIIAKNLADMSKAHMAAKEKRIQTQSLYNSKGKLSGSLNVDENPLIQEHKKELGKLESTYLANLELFKPDYPSMLSLQEQINSRKALIAKESDHISASTTNNMKASYEAAMAEESKLENEIKLLEKELLQFRDDSIGYANLKRDVDTSRSLYDGLLQRLKEISVVETAQTGSVSVVDKAILPSRKDGPSYPKYALLGLLSGLFLSALAVMMRETVQPKIRLTADLQDIGGKYQVLHSLPFSKHLRGSTAELLRKNPNPTWLDALRYLKTSLVLANNGRFPQILHLTSALPGEGKSTTAVNLALMLANTGNKVLLIDADLRKPTVHKHLELDNSYGLTHYLTGTASESPLTRVKGLRLLFVICAGPAVPDPVEALSGTHMQTLLNKSREVFDYVIIDAPPVLGMADSLLLANRADGTLLIAANNRSSKQDVRTAIDCLEKSHGKILGLVQNMVPNKTSNTTSYYTDGRSMIAHA
ncbi:polysaccharide biosynthesis tyrosine autokinase [Thiothrix fructosivorans]|uniref:Polysaccharide biosynthesis tyrosine autokinase n=1 Tax=Thiothrix fructosivorans TaxID=111770 RepID=A0A8B0SMZ4_9GAMM|nr:polysaccharide biosynthesis tyrosine autokinase [Thiothrix fructosivorans]MBO0612193.1 polysaccharide biosynthesis tyrosine autokinase [Thiothrix fructosivorans]QTX12314.1 polysaccharide biosynthesis tyrosine autokinase [Thiothrix fructosivorans]